MAKASWKLCSISGAQTPSASLPETSLSSSNSDESNWVIFWLRSALRPGTRTASVVCIFRGVCCCAGSSSSEVEVGSAFRFFKVVAVAFFFVLWAAKEVLASSLSSTGDALASPSTVDDGQVSSSEVILTLYTNLKDKQTKLAHDSSTSNIREFVIKILGKLTTSKFQSGRPGSEIPQTAKFVTLSAFYFKLLFRGAEFPRKKVQMLCYIFSTFSFFLAFHFAGVKVESSNFRAGQKRESHFWNLFHFKDEKHWEREQKISISISTICLALFLRLIHFLPAAYEKLKSE